MNNSDMPAMPQSIMKSAKLYAQDYAIDPDNATSMIDYAGLSKREHFAAMAMQGLLSKGFVPTGNIFDKTAEASLGYADALLSSLEGL